MSKIEVFETTVQKSYEWLNDLNKLLGWKDSHRSYLALRATLHALRDRLPVDIGANFSSQLPMLIRGFYFESWQPSSTPVKARSAAEFLNLVAIHLDNTILAHEEDLEKVVRSVFIVITSHISIGEIYHIKRALPEPIALLWPSIEFSEELEREIKSDPLSKL